MRPIKLVMSAFGSYGGREEVDFADRNRGIFLITGDTGAGKTTIFDAITYALFDETSGGRRNGDMMRSQFADEGTPTFVELVFSYGGKEYRVQRNPNYQRISKRKNKAGEYSFTTEAAGVELTLPDGTAFTGKNKETNERIREILGVDVHQFTQICMIAQGEFLKLLHAPSRERKEIFSRIFDTKIYWQIQNRLKDQSKELYVRLEENRTILEHELKQVRRLPKEHFAWEGKAHVEPESNGAPAGEACVEPEGNGVPAGEVQSQPESNGAPGEEPYLEPERLWEEWEQAKLRVETGQEVILSCLVRMDAAAEEQEAAIRTQEQTVSSELDQVKVALAQVKEWNRRFEQQQETERSVADIRRKLAGIREKLAEWNGHQRQLTQAREERLPLLEQELAEAKNLLPKYESYGQQQARTQNLQTEQKRMKESWQQAREQAEALEREIAALTERQQELAEETEQLAALQQQEKELAVQKEELQTVIAQGEQLIRRERALGKAKRCVEEALLRFEEKSRCYEQCQRIFIREQAGLLADGLTEGEPCPVCGATHHPKRAQLPLEAVTQRQVEQAKEQREEAQAGVNREQAQFAEQKEQWESEWKLFLYQGQRLLGEEFGQRAADLQESQRQLTEALACGSGQLGALKSQIAHLEAQQRLRKQQAQQLLQRTQQREQLGQQCEQLQQKVYEADLAYEKAAQSLQELKQTLTYPSIQAVEARLAALSEEKRQLEEKQKTVQDTLQTLAQQLAKGEGALEEQEKQLALLKEGLQGKTRTDPFVLNQRLEELTERKAGFEERRQELVSILKANRQVEANLQTLYETRTALAGQYEVAETLSRTANGNLRQQVRLDLQTYVQRRYFKQIIHQANRRLVEMSGGQFILQCREIEALARQQEAGLDLDVYDLVTDRTRDVKTLSGGESFLAALSMALGMADVVQRSAGKVHLDTMFIDEGFGSLDEDARGKAIEILKQLAGETRLVGIISHVTELKEQMDQKLMIRKGKHGSQARWQD